MNDTGLRMAELDNVSKNMKLELVVKHLTLENDNDTAKKIICDVCLRGTSEEMAKYGMEFFYINGYIAELQMLIDYNKESRNESNRKWAEVYQLASDYFFTKNGIQP
ncbi:MAG TPA: hypothetical protein VK142_04285, partial [Bacillota bacterium]|nr:hypothetical protein [Bacillota bacterium]